MNSLWMATGSMLGTSAKLKRLLRTIFRKLLLPTSRAAVASNAGAAGLVQGSDLRHSGDHTGGHDLLQHV